MRDGGMSFLAMVIAGIIVVVLTLAMVLVRAQREPALGMSFQSEMVRPIAK